MVDLLLANNLIAAVRQRPTVVAAEVAKAQRVWISLKAHVANELAREQSARKQTAASTCEALGTNLDFLEQIIRRVRGAVGPSDEIVRSAVGAQDRDELYRLLEFPDLRRFIGESNLAHLMKVPHA